jgi:multiple sugar transport system permease protein
MAVTHLTVSVTGPSRKASSLAAHLVLLLIGACFAVPFVWLVFAAINSNSTLAADIPTRPTLANFRHVLTWNTTIHPMINGLFLAGGSAVVTVAAAALAAYPLSRHSMRFKRPFLYTILFATGLPITAIMVPVYELFVQLNLIDSMIATIFFLSATSLPYAIWLTKNFMDSVPLSLEEAAWVDGASGLSTLRTVVLPLMVPGLSVVGIFIFILAWGNFFVPFILLLSPGKQPISVSIFTFFGQYGSVAYGQLAAYSVVLLYIGVSKAFGGAFSLGGATKG